MHGSAMWYDVGLCGIDFFQFGFSSIFEKKTLIWFGMSSVQKTRFGSDIVISSK